MGYKHFITRENSKAILEDYRLNNTFQTLYPNFDLHAADKVVYSDPVVMGALKQFVDKFMEGGYKLLKKDSKELDVQTKERLEQDFMFGTAINRSVAVQAFKYQNAFIEVVRGEASGEVVGLNVLDAKHIQPITKANGDPLKYRWRIANPDQKDVSYPEWSKDEVVWLKFYDSGEGWSPVDIQTLYKWVTLKVGIRNYVNWLWQTGQYRVVHNFKDADSGAKDDFIDDFLAFISNHDDDPTKPFITRGAYTVEQTRDMKETEYYTQLFNYIDQQILICLRVPPIDAGIPDASGRSNADAQSNNFSTTIRGWKRVMKSYYDHKLFPLLYKGNTEIVWMPNDRFQKKQVIDEINTFMNNGFSEEFVKQYMAEAGMIYDVPNYFKKQDDGVQKNEEEREVEEDQEEPEEVSGVKKDIDLMPSRAGIDDGGVSEKIGTGEDGSTRDDQL